MELEGFNSVDGIELVQKTPLFRRLSFEETNRLAAIMERVDLPADATVIEANALGDALYLILSGQVRVWRDVDLDGKQSDREVLGTLGPGELFGEMSLVDDLLTSATITTLEEVRLLKIPRARFEALLAGDEALALKVYRAFCQTLSERLRRANLQLLDHPSQHPGSR